MHDTVAARVRKANKQITPQPVFTNTVPEWEARDILAAIFLQKNANASMLQWLIHTHGRNSNGIVLLWPLLMCLSVYFSLAFKWTMIEMAMDLQCSVRNKTEVTVMCQRMELYGA